LRDAGLAVRVVGLSGWQAIGQQGLLLGSDWTLERALSLATPVSGVILPCTPATVRRIDKDPRVYQLLAQASATQPLVVLQTAAAVDGSQLEALPIPKENIIVYCETDDLIALARTLALMLLNLAH
jgi:hypothetical protein